MAGTAPQTPCRPSGPSPVFAYIVRRLLSAILLLLIVTAITFAIFFLVPRLAGQSVDDLAARYAGRDITPAVLAGIKAKLGFDKLVPLSLIVSEAVTNSLKHAFPAGRAGRIDLGLGRASEGWKLTIQDNGQGFPAGFRPQDGNRLGFKITEQLARQMNGQLAYQNDGGASLRLVFPD